MIQIKIMRNSSQAIVGFSVNGHAGAAPRGYDIVCAGVSALTQAAVLGLERHLGRSFQLVIAEGNLELELADNPDALTNAVLETMFIGLTEIAKINPRSVRISEHGR